MCVLPTSASPAATISSPCLWFKRDHWLLCLGGVTRYTAVSKPDHDPEIRLKRNRYAHMQVQHPREFDCLLRGESSTQPTDEISLAGKSHFHSSSVLVLPSRPSITWPSPRNQDTSCTVAVGQFFLKLIPTSWTIQLKSVRPTTKNLDPFV